MKFLLAAINAKYIHSNLGVYSLKRYGEEHVPGAEIEIGEYTINHQMDKILEDIFRRKPDAVGFSCYIWNISHVMELVRDIHKIMPHIRIWMGGPEVSYCAKELLEKEDSIDGIMIGEGEKTFAGLLQVYREGSDSEGLKTLKNLEDLKELPGIAFRAGKEIIVNPPGELLSLDEIPFSYENLDEFENRIIYYESSRGCPFSCSYCLSSIDKTVRFRSLSLVKEELAFFLERQVKQVKFVDRTFNCKKSHAMEIWKFIHEHDNGITNFHFEISADLLDEEELRLISAMRPGLIQLEIGVQTTNSKTIQEIRRKTDLEKLKRIVAEIKTFHNIHQHLDLIAGLPYEDYESFGNSFNDVYHMEPDELQLGFLKVLKGSYMEMAAPEYGLLYRSVPPYEVLGTKWLDYGDIIRLKGIEEMVEVYYNSHQFEQTIRELEQEFESPFVMFEKLAQYYEKNGLFAEGHSRIARYEILYGFIRESVGPLKGQNAEDALKKYRDLLISDLYLRENAKSRPAFASDQTQFKEEAKPYYEEYFAVRGNRDKRMVHIEVMESGEIVLFDYGDRDPLSYNAFTRVLAKRQR